MLFEPKKVAVIGGYMTELSIHSWECAYIVAVAVDVNGDVSNPFKQPVSLGPKFAPHCHHHMWHPDAPPIDKAVTALRDWLRVQRAMGIVHLQDMGAVAASVVDAGMPEAAVHNVSAQVRAKLSEAVGLMPPDTQILHSLASYCAGATGIRPYYELSDELPCVQSTMAFARCVGTMRKTGVKS